VVRLVEEQQRRMQPTPTTVPTDSRTHREVRNQGSMFDGFDYLPPENVDEVDNSASVPDSLPNGPTIAEEEGAPPPTSGPHGCDDPDVFTEALEQNRPYPLYYHLLFLLFHLFCFILF